MLKLRLKRTGRKNDPSFRVVITENTAPPKGKYLESVGSYRPASKELKLDKERIEYWLSKGVRPTDVVHNILVKEGILDASKVSVHSTRVRKKAAEAAAAEKKEEDAKKETAAVEKPAEETIDNEEAKPLTDPSRQGEDEAEPRSGSGDGETKTEGAPAEETKPEEPATEAPAEEPATQEEAPKEEVPTEEPRSEEKPAEEPAKEKPKEDEKSTEEDKEKVDKKE
ncbi:MAG: 30S ribosomal protein S16 [Candidatus Spechtbacterales bacterium]